MSHTEEIRNNPNSFYARIKAKSEKGELNWKTVTKRELYFLNLVERVTDSEIGKLYGVALNTVTNRRKKNGINMMWKHDADETCQDIERHIWETLRHSQKKEIDYASLYRILDAIHPDYDEVAL